MRRRDRVELAGADGAGDEPLWMRFGVHLADVAVHGGAVERRATASVSYVRGKFGRSARAFSRPIAPSSAADKPSSFMRRAVSFSGTNGLSLPNKI